MLFNCVVFFKFLGDTWLCYLACRPINLLTHLHTELIRLLTNYFLGYVVSSYLAPTLDTLVGAIHFHPCWVGWEALSILVDVSIVDASHNVRWCWSVHGHPWLCKRQFTDCLVRTVMKYYYLFWKSRILNHRFSYIEALFSLCCNTNICHSPKP